MGWGWGGNCLPPWQSEVGAEREREPQDRAWQMCPWKAARALLIKHNEAWDHKLLHRTPGSHDVGAAQWGWRRRKVPRGSPVAELGVGQQPPCFRSRVRVGSLTGLCPSSERRGNQRLCPRHGPLLLVTRDTSLSSLCPSSPIYRGKGGSIRHRKAPEPPPAPTVETVSPSPIHSFPHSFLAVGPLHSKYS